MAPSLIEREFGLAIAEIRQVVSAMLIETPLADLLGVKPGSAGEITDTCYPADRVSVSFQLKRSKPPR
jgi:GntR family transcriptional regulator